MPSCHPLRKGQAHGMLVVAGIITLAPEHCQMPNSMVLWNKSKLQHCHAFLQGKHCMLELKKLSPKMLILKLGYKLCVHTQYKNVKLKLGYKLCMRTQSKNVKLELGYKCMLYPFTCIYAFRSHHKLYLSDKTNPSLFVAQLLWQARYYSLFLP